MPLVMDSCVQDRPGMLNHDDNLCFLIHLADGLQVEAVYYGSGTLCISSQAGCGVGCPFCASGAHGLLRNLSRAELHHQLQWVRNQGISPRALTLSGIGEPLHNPVAVAEFLGDCIAAGLPPSLTTIGAPLNHLRQFLQLPHNGLTLSLHAGQVATHQRLIPAGPDLDQLFALLLQLWPQLSRRRRRKIAINYLLLHQINDSPAELDALLTRLRPFPEPTIHLLSCNPVPGSRFRSPPADQQQLWYQTLRAAGLNARRPNRWRRQRRGGCGTLVARAAGSLLPHTLDHCFNNGSDDGRLVGK